MRDDYKLKGKTTKISIEVEQAVADTLLAMEKYVTLTPSELANTALKRFITHHSDFLPTPDAQKRG